MYEQGLKDALGVMEGPVGQCQGLSFGFRRGPAWGCVGVYLVRQGRKDRGAK
jgi:hypothetical protein